MFKLHILSQFTSALLTILIGVGVLFLIRKKTAQNVKENKPAGFWVRVICLGIDFAIIDFVVSLLAYRGSLSASGQITILLTFSYFFFSWLFFAATPAMIFAKIKILSGDSKPLKIWQILTRLSVFIFLFIGWVTILFDKKKRALHDIAAQTYVVYAGKGKETTDKTLTKKAKFLLLILVLVLLIGLIVNGLGEKLSSYTENEQVSFFDLNSDKTPDGLTIDTDKDDDVDTFKYDLDNDRVIDFTTFDTDKDGVAESIDMNNDGKIDGFDFDNDNVLDIEVTEGQNVILVWKILFGVWVVCFVTLLGFSMVKERSLGRKA